MQSHESYTRFLRYRDAFAKLNLQLYREFHQSQADLIKSNPSKFWKRVNARRSTSGIPRLVRHGASESADLKGTANLFADFFEGVYASDKVSPDLPQGPSAETTTCHRLSADEIEKAISELDVTKGGGPDLIPNALLKPLATELTPALQLIFNQSLSAGIFPTVWKKSFIVPIFKSGDRSSCSNYRGIAILSAIPKLFEKLVCSFLETSLGGLVHGVQHGFRSGRSTSTNLTIFVDSVLKIMSSHGQADAIYTDFSKAFDRVNHKLLIQKLRLMGLGGTLLSWLQSYLTNRTQSVRIGDALSRDVASISGVPQGSHLGPLLFALFVNDLVEVFNDCEVLMYADDLKFFRSVTSSADAGVMGSNLKRVLDICYYGR